MEDKSGMARGYNIRALLLSNFPALEESISEFKKAYQLYKETGKLKGGYSVLNNLGVIYNDAGMYKDGLASHLQVLEFHRTEENVIPLSRSLYNLANSCAGLRQWQDALDYSLESYSKRKTTSNIPAVIESECQLADIRIRAKEDHFIVNRSLKEIGYNSEIEMLEHALQLAEESKHMMPVSLQKLGLVKGYRNGISK